jgi:hypothetical protein
LTLQRILRAIGERDGSWYVEDYAVLDAEGQRLRLFERCSWADWDTAGNLLIAADGCLYRLESRACATVHDTPLADATLVCDLNPLRFEAREAPDWARKWP